MRLGYNSNGWMCHRWTDALELMADIGYESVALTLDHACLDPYSADLPGEMARMRRTLERLHLSSVIETGARFLLDPRHKHEPTLLSADEAGRARRLDFLCRAVDIAADLGSDAVSFWSGVLREDITPAVALDRLAAGCAALIEHAARRGVVLAFEPEPGMFIDTFAMFEKLLARVDAPHFKLTVDIGHVHCIEEGAIAPHLHRWSDRLANIHIEDMRRHIHEHLRFGEGEIDFAPVLQALRDIHYPGGLHVELSRHSHMAPEVMRESYHFLTSRR